MADGRGTFLRNTAAILICLSGAAQIGALWLRDLTDTALLDGLLGAVYLIIGLGLFGVARFSLFMAILVPGAAIGALLYAEPHPNPVYTLRIAVDIAVILLSTIVLWRVRHHPSI